MTTVAIIALTVGQFLLVAAVLYLNRAHRRLLGMVVGTPRPARGSCICTRSPHLPDCPDPEAHPDWGIPLRPIPHL